MISNIDRIHARQNAMFIPIDSKNEDTRKQLILPNAQYRETGIYTIDPKPRPQPVPPSKPYKSMPVLRDPTWAIVRSKVINEPTSIIEKFTPSKSLDMFDYSKDKTVKLAHDLFCGMTAGLWLALEPSQLKYLRYPATPLTVRAAVNMWSFAFCDAVLKHYVLQPRVSSILPLLCSLITMTCQ
jgi:hypothetical protein